MVSAMNTAISAGADGICVCLIDAKAFNGPTEKALKAGIPVIAYNADVPPGSGNQRLAYIGQDLFVSGQKMGEKIVELIPSGDVAGFIATPGSLNIQPRIDGAKQAIKDSGKPINFTQIATGADTAGELSKIDAYYQGHKDLKGMFAVDAGSTQGVAQVMQKYNLPAKGIHGGGYDLLPTTLNLINKRLPGLHDRPAALSPGVLPRGSAVPVQDLGRPDGTFRHEHRSTVRHEGQRQAVPDDEDPLRGKLQLPAIREVDLAA